MKVSLGLLEVRGLALAINTADAMAKCAAINIIGIDTARGGGWMTIKVTGDVASVQAAIATGAALAEQSKGLIAQKVLSRPDAKLLASMIPTEKPEPAPQDKASQEQEPEKEKTDAEPEEQKPVTKLAPADQKEAHLEESIPADNLLVAAEPPQDEKIAEKSSSTESNSEEAKPEKPLIATCNLCQDPACPRKKGEPRIDCIHEGKKR